MFDTSTPALKTVWLPATNPLRAAWKEAHGRRQLRAEETLAIREGEARKVQGLEWSHPWGDGFRFYGENPWEIHGGNKNHGEMVTWWSMYIHVYNRLQQFSKEEKHMCQTGRSSADRSSSVIFHSYVGLPDECFRTWGNIIQDHLTACI